MVAPRIYPSLPGSTPFYCDHVKCIRLPEYTPPSQNIPLFSTTICDPPRIYPPPPEYIPFSTTIILCDPPRIYPSLPESTPLFNQFMCATTTICDPPRIHPPPPEHTPFSTTVCDLPRIYPSLPEYRPTPFSTNVYVRPSHNLPLPSRIYPPFQQMYVRPSQNLPPLPEYTPLFNNYMRLSQNIPLPPRIYPLFNNYAIIRPSQNLPTFSTNLCVRPSLSVTSAAPVCDDVAYTHCLYRLV